MGGGPVWQRFRRSRIAAIALVWICVMIATALLAPLLATEKPLAVRTNGEWRFPPIGEARARERAGSDLVIRAPLSYSPDTVNLAARLQPPGIEHPLGTDDLGRDVLARMIHGARVSLAVGIVATLISLLVGSLLGALAGYYGGAVDWCVSRVIEVVLCFPFLFLVLGIVALFRPSFWTMILALGLTSWTTEARFLRGEFLRIRDSTFAQAARAIGAGDARIICRHLLPNAIAPVLVSASFGVAGAILTESALSFLGLGVPLPTATWGGVLSSAYQHVEYAWWLVLFPGIAIFCTVAAFNAMGEALREALDPRQRDRITTSP
jgi:peptide/nickel transport system permease protein